jgi:mono/diheme cytochrome c family protein
MYGRFYSSLLLISGVALLAFSLLAGVREASPEWKGYQSRYMELFMERATGDFMKEKARAVNYGIRQIYLRDLDRIDRCTSCHLGVENPLMDGAEAPFARHSGDHLINHSVNEFGCTVCHYGQGRATNSKEAHGIDYGAYWNYPVAPLKYIESSCAQCHGLKMLEESGASSVFVGERLFREKGCKGCHKLDGVGGILGKPLDGIGSQPKAYFSMRHVEGEKTSYTWLKEHFEDPRAVVPDSKMRIVGMTEAEANDLTTYVLTIRASEMPRKYRRIEPQPPGEMTGENLYQMYCVACHTTGEHSVYDEIFGRTIPAVKNPAFLKVADDRQLKRFIEDGRPETEMTDWKADAAGLSDSEIDRIVEYLGQGRPDELPEPFELPIDDGNVESGREIYELRCALCHGKDGKGGQGVLGISLTNPVVQRANPQFLLLTVRDGRAGTPMVPFGEAGLKLSDREILDVVAYVRSMTDRVADGELNTGNQVKSDD